MAKLSMTRQEYYNLHQKVYIGAKVRIDGLRVENFISDKLDLRFMSDAMMLSMCRVLNNDLPYNKTNIIKVQRLSNYLFGKNME